MGIPLRGSLERTRDADYVGILSVALDSVRYVLLIIYGKAKAMTNPFDDEDKNPYSSDDFQPYPPVDHPEDRYDGFGNRITPAQSQPQTHERFHSRLKLPMRSASGEVSGLGDTMAIMFKAYASYLRTFLPWGLISVIIPVFLALSISIALFGTDFAAEANAAEFSERQLVTQLLAGLLGLTFLPVTARLAFLAIDDKEVGIAQGLKGYSYLTALVTALLANGLVLALVLGLSVPVFMVSPILGFLVLVLVGLCLVPVSVLPVYYVVDGDSLGAAFGRVFALLKTKDYFRFLLVYGIIAVLLTVSVLFTLLLSLVVIGPLCALAAAYLVRSMGDKEIPQQPASYQVN